MSYEVAGCILRASGGCVEGGVLYPAPYVGGVGVTSAYIGGRNVAEAGWADCEEDENQENPTPFTYELQQLEYQVGAHSF